MPRLRATIGQLLVNEALPPPLRDYNRQLNKSGLTDLMKRVATEHPEKYREVSHALSNVGRDAAHITGGNSFGLSHITFSPAIAKQRQKLEVDLDRIDQDTSLSDKDREEKIQVLLGRAAAGQQKTVMDEAVAEGNPLARQIQSGARGNPGNLVSLRASDMLYTDHKGRVLPIPVLKSYSQGLSPAEYWAGAYGARRGVLSTKFATRDAGYLSKQLAQMSHRGLVTALDNEEEPDTLRGFPVDTNEAHNEGALLAAPAGGYGRNTILTPKIMADIQRRGHERILIRSPAVGSAPDGGLLARDVGVREFGDLPTIGSNVAMAGANALSEPISQGSLCLAEGTLVRMHDDTNKTIEEVRVGDWVWGCDLTGKARQVRVLDVFDNGDQECVETVFSRPYIMEGEDISVISTVHHNLLAARQVSGQLEEALNFVPRILPIGKKSRSFYAVPPQNFQLDSAAEDTHPLSELLGLLVADGCYTESVHGIFLSCADHSLIDYMNALILEEGLEIRFNKGSECYWRVACDKARDEHVKTADGRVAVGTRHPVKAFLEARGMYGKYAHEKEFSEDMMAWPKEGLRRLLRGVFAGDGGVADCDGKPGLSYSSVSENLVKQIAFLLKWRFAIEPGKVYRADARGYGNHDDYKFSITHHGQVRKFMDEIGIPGIKGEKLSELHRSWKAGSKQCTDRYYFMRRSQKPVGVKHVFDLEVDHPDHLFLLDNGLVVSNSEKHSGGVIGSGGAVSGFEHINQLLNPPKIFKGGATHADVDGTVEKIEEAPAGGHQITINSHKHYVPEETELHVKRGDKVEAGDVLSGGIPNPAKIIANKGIGEGRHYFVKSFMGALKGANLKADRRNVELLSRHLIDHVRLTDTVGGNVPDDVVSYQHLENEYEPREDAIDMKPASAVGRYLEKPYLHHTVGTKVRPSMLKDFKDFGVDSVKVHHNPPPFEPVMVRSEVNLRQDPDWMTRMFGSGLKGGLLKGVHRGDRSTEFGTSFVPGLAKGVNFGDVGKVRPSQPQGVAQQ